MKSKKRPGFLRPISIPKAMVPRATRARIAPSNFFIKLALNGLGDAVAASDSAKNSLSTQIDDLKSQVSANADPSGIYATAIKMQQDMAQYSSWSSSWAPISLSGYYSSDSINADLASIVAKFASQASNPSTQAAIQAAPTAQVESIADGTACTDSNKNPSTYKNGVCQTASLMPSQAGDLSTAAATGNLQAPPDDSVKAQLTTSTDTLLAQSLNKSTTTDQFVAALGQAEGLLAQVMQYQSWTGNMKGIIPCAGVFGYCYADSSDIKSNLIQAKTNCEINMRAAATAATAAGDTATANALNANVEAGVTQGARTGTGVDTSINVYRDTASNLPQAAKDLAKCYSDIPSMISDCIATPTRLYSDNTGCCPYNPPSFLKFMLKHWKAFAIGGGTLIGVGVLLSVKPALRAATFGALNKKSNRKRLKRK